MTENNLILNRFFTQNFLFSMVNSNFNDTTYGAVIQRFVSAPGNRDNGALISEIYKFMSKAYRNEYFYQNTLLNKLLLGKHSVNTTTALTQVPICKSKADFILINGKAVVYEIKTDLDSFDRLGTQLRDYFKAFNHVCVVTSESQYERAVNILQGTQVGIYVLTPQNTISTKLRKEPEENNSQLDHTAIFKILHKREYENILLQYFGKLPVASQVFYYGECLKQFSQIPIVRAYGMALKQLKKRNRIRVNEFKKIPYELKSLIYFASPSISDWQAINGFLNQKYGG
ncbi:sce7726 family protein [Pyramidobacter piscolens]|uniref:sce7726 family protein n=2 Tax=Pyramidobacter piscolens TaxID=638849 RepID=UPI00058E797C|nr:sce7726 family protein [Pyramidobacter piscolens]